MRGAPQAATQTSSPRNPRQCRSLRQYLCPSCRLTLATTLFAVAFSISHRPLVSRFQWITAFLTLNPSLKSGLIYRQVEHLRSTEQFGECLHHFRCGGKDNLVHGFRLALASVCVEINPASIRPEHKHPFLCQRIAWGHARLSHQIRTALAAGAQV